MSTIEQIKEEVYTISKLRFNIGDKVLRKFAFEATDNHEDAFSLLKCFDLYDSIKKD